MACHRRKDLLCIVHGTYQAAETCQASSWKEHWCHRSGVSVAACRGRKGRELEVVTQWESAYKKLRKDMRCDTIISSLDNDFSSVFMVADMWALSCDVWIGDYPYLNKRAFRQCIADVTSSTSELYGESKVDDERFRETVLHPGLGRKTVPEKSTTSVRQVSGALEGDETLHVD